MRKKYEFTGKEKVVDGVILKQIKAIISFGVIESGTIGGWIEKETNLSHYGNAWVSGNARVRDDAIVSENAVVSENTIVGGSAWVRGNAVVNGNARVSENAVVNGNAIVGENAIVSENAWVSGNAVVNGNAWVSGNARVNGNAWVSGNARVFRDKDYATIDGFGASTITFFKCADGKIRLNCLKFNGTIDEYREYIHGTMKVKNVNEYLMLADLMDYHFKNED